MASIRCGNCHNTHTSTLEVRNCYSGQHVPAARPAFDSVARGSSRYGRASEKQLEYIRSLLGSRNLTGTFYANVTDDWLSSIGSNEASTTIDDLKALPYKPKETKAAKESGPILELEDAIYLKDGKIFKVYHTVHGANQQVAKELVFLPEDQWYTKIVRGKEVEVKAEFEYRGKGPLHGLTAEHKMTKEDAVKYGAVYGVCVRCAATLTKEESIDRAMGPVCYSKMGG